jgi:urease accessory protein
VTVGRVGREGRLSLRFERRGEATALVTCRCAVPLQVLAPLALDDPAAVVSILNPTGGLAGGDRLSIDVALGPGAHACLTAPSATRVYRTDGAPTVQEVRATVGPGATLEWVPEHTIPFPGSALSQSLDVTLAGGARLILVDAFAAGRVARGEAWRFARLQSAITVRDARGWRFIDRLALTGGDAGFCGGAGVTDGHPYFATVVVAGDGDAGDLADAVAGALAGRQDVTAGAGALRRGGLVARVLARTAPALLGALDAAWAQARHGLLGLPPLALRRG